MRTRVVIVAILVLLTGFRAKADTFVTTYGAPGVQWPDAIVRANAGVTGVETFDDIPVASANQAGFVTDYGTQGVIIGSYSPGIVIFPADMLGGAGGNGQYAAALRTTSGYSVTLKKKGIPGVNYFGFWLSALDSGNELTFYRDGVKVGEYEPAKMLAALGQCPTQSRTGQTLPVPSPSPYCDNRNLSEVRKRHPHWIGQPWELYAFVNFVDTNGYFDEIRFAESPGRPGNYESDNHTVAYCPDPNSCVSGSAVATAAVRKFAAGGYR